MSVYRKNKTMAFLSAACLIFSLATSTRVPAAAAGAYHAGDVETINEMIEKNGLKLDPAPEPVDGTEIPEDWKDAIVWSDTAEKRIVELRLNGKGLTGELDLSGLDELVKLDLGQNRLTQLSLSVVSLEFLNCSRNALKKIILRENKKFEPETAVDVRYNNLPADAAAELYSGDWDEKESQRFAPQFTDAYEKIEVGAQDAVPVAGTAGDVSYALQTDFSAGTYRALIMRNDGAGGLPSGVTMKGSQITFDDSGKGTLQLDYTASAAAGTAGNLRIVIEDMDKQIFAVSEPFEFRIDKPYIGNQTILIAAPVTGETPQTNAAPGPGFSDSEKNTIAWYNVTDSINHPRAPFEGGRVYRAEVVLVSNDGYLWPDDPPAITVPGQTVGEITVNGTDTGNALTFFVTFGMTETTAVTYAVAFNASGGTVSPDAAETDSSGVLSALPVPAKEGYVFNGWFTAISGGAEIIETHVFTSDTTIFAQWKDTEVTFTAVQAGGASDTADSTGLQIAFSQPVTGLAAGDIDIINGTGSVTRGVFSGSGTTYAVALTAVAAQGDIIVSVGNFGSFAVTTPQQTVAVYKSKPAPTPTPTPTPTPKPTPTPTPTPLPSPAPMPTPTPPPTYTVRFNANGGSVDVHLMQTDFNGMLAWLPTPTRKDHAFAGWYTRVNGGRLVTWSTVFTADTVIYAQWTEQALAFTVNPANHAFTDAQPGYSNNGMEQVFTITNVGTGQITGLNAVWADNGGSFFQINSPIQSTALNPGSSTRLGVRPQNNLAANGSPYAGTLLITANNGNLSVYVPLRFTVEPPPAQQTIKYGDINNDGFVNSADLVLLLRFFAQPGVNINMAAADVNGDGSVNNADLIHFMRYFAQPGVKLGP